MFAFPPALVVVALLLQSVAPPPAASELDTILNDWWLATSHIRRLDCDFALIKYDQTFEIETRGTGSLAITRTGQAFYKVAPAAIRPGSLGRKVGTSNDRMILRAASAECWYWTGDGIIHVDDVDRTFEEFRFPEFHPESPALPADQPSRVGNASAASARQHGVKYSTADVGICEAIRILVAADLGAFFKLFHESIQEFWLARPFLLGMPIDELRHRFRIELQVQNENEIRLKFEPKSERDQARFSRATLILRKERYEPRAIKMIDSTGSATVHVFADVRVNSNWRDVYFSRDPLSRPDLRGYRSVNVVTAPTVRALKQKDNPKLPDDAR
jgi:hypothetical protein